MPETFDDLLGLTAAGFVAHGRARGLRNDEALASYRAFHRDGSLPVTGGPPTISRTHTEDTPEGPTTKFCISVPRDRPDVRGGTARLVQEPTTPNAIAPGPVAVGPVAVGPVAVDRPPPPALPVLTGSLETESVLIPMISKLGELTYTLCVSSQIGCAMNCGFCETAQMGLIRNLTAAEIVAQWWVARHLVLKGPIDNIVFMGMGEPMDNYDEVEQAIRVLADHNGPSVAASKITVSTVGRIDGLKRYARLVAERGFYRLGLAISINAPSDAIRDRIMPINRAMPMAALRDAVLAFPRMVAEHAASLPADDGDTSRSRRPDRLPGLAPGKKICFEYVLIPGVNDQQQHAHELAEYLRPFSAEPEPGGPRRTPVGMVNLIPYNPRRNSPWPAPEEEHVERFMRWLMDEGVFVKRRRTKGRATMAACGQLGNESIRGRRVIAPAAATDHGRDGVTRE